MRALLCIAALALGCTPGVAPRSEPMKNAETTITADGLLRHITALSSDRFGGRAPGTEGEALTVGYIQAELQRAGLAPGNPDGSWVQTVPLVAITSTSTLAFDGKPLQPADDFVAWSVGAAPKVDVANSEMVFVGYGIVAPERDRDDYKDVDVRGKTVVILVGDPFGGPKLTYFGRWTYKFEQAAKKGARAALIVHETGPAGYGWNVVSGGGVREHYEIATDEARNAHVPVEGWIHEDRAKSLIPGFDAKKAAAREKDFRPIALPQRADLRVTSTSREVITKNVIGRVVGTDLKDEHVVYSAHWDHFGTTPKGIFHGALDNASGVAWLLETARAFTTLKTPPRRSILFTAFTAEESGLLGAKYYCAHPLHSLESTVANVNMDIMNPWGRTRAIVSLGLGQTTMDAVLADEASHQGRHLVPDPEGEKGYYYRSDHFEFAKHGVPALGFLFPGADYIDQPPDFGDQKRKDYIAHRYHSPNDVIAPDWDLAGTVEDTVLLFRVGHRIADAPTAPAWTPDAEFRSRR